MPHSYLPPTDVFQDFKYEMSGPFRADGKPETTLVLAIASGGGHWKQLLEISSGVTEFDWVYITTDIGFEPDVSIAHESVTDANLKTPLKIARLLLQTYTCIRKHEPAYILSTGALPGLAFVVVGRLLGIKTMWIDSIANADKLSLCGVIALRVASVTATQWEHIAGEHKGLKYAGSVL
jgi:UDP-N-acetylglucosamine:LPS N-acetylglucosamine transferase